MDQQLETSVAYCNRWAISKQKINIFTEQLNQAQNIVGTWESSYSSNWRNGIRDFTWWLDLPVTFGKTIASLFVLFIIIGALVEKFFPVVPQWLRYTLNVDGTGLMFYFALLLLISTAAVILLDAICTDSEYKRDWERFEAKQNQTRGNVIPKLNALIEEENRVIANLEYNMITLGQCIIPQKYWQYGDILYGYIQDRRANTLSEAINLLVFEQRQNYNTQLLEQSEQHARETKELARISAQNSEIAAKEAERAADNAEIAAWFSAMAYFDRKK